MVDYRTLAIVLAFQAPFICLIISVYYFITLGRNGYNRVQYFLAKFLSVSCIGNMIFEVLCGLMNYEVLSINNDMYVWLILIAYFFMLLNAVIWSEFAISRAHNPSPVLTTIIRMLYFVVFVLLTCRIAFRDTHLFLYFEDGVQKYGPLDDVQSYACLLIYLLLMFVLIARYNDKADFAYKEVHGKLLFANSVVLIALLIYVVFFYPYIVWIGQMLVLLYIYMSNQRSSIYNDELTHLYNRRMMIKDMSEKMKDNRGWSLLLFDVDFFKKINDNYGHSEGDRALAKVASVLDGVARANEACAYRYAGDEFIIIVDTTDDAILRNICAEIDSRLETGNQEDNLPYALSLSSGFAVYDEALATTIPDIIELADMRMYEIKKAKKEETKAAEE